MVNSNKAGLDLRESPPLPHSACLRQRASQKVPSIQSDFRGWLLFFTSQKDSTDYLSYSVGARDTATSGIGLIDNRHLNYLVESISVNVGDSRQNAKASSLPMTDGRVGAVIVVRGWESQPHGEGPQSVGTSNAKVTECQHGELYHECR
jgi:hypothetical protein